MFAIGVVWRKEGGKCGRLELNDDGQYVAEEAARAFGFARVGRYAF